MQIKHVLITAVAGVSLVTVQAAPTTILDPSTLQSLYVQEMAQGHVAAYSAVSAHTPWQSRRTYLENGGQLVLASQVQEIYTRVPTSGYPGYKDISATESGFAQVGSWAGTLRAESVISGPTMAHPFGTDWTTDMAHGQVISGPMDNIVMAGWTDSYVIHGGSFTIAGHSDFILKGGGSAHEDFTHTLKVAVQRAGSNGSWIGGFDTFADRAYTSYLGITEQKKNGDGYCAAAGATCVYVSQVDQSTGFVSIDFSVSFFSAADYRVVLSQEIFGINTLSVGGSAGQSRIDSLNTSRIDAVQYSGVGGFTAASGALSYSSTDQAWHYPEAPLLASAVPEPNRAVLTLAGVLALGVCARRRRGMTGSR